MPSGAIRLRFLGVADDDLAEIASQLNNKQNFGDYDNEFTAESLRKFLEDENHFYLIAYIGDQLAGASHAYLMQHPGGPKYLYIDEIDTAKPYRRQGVATAMMKELIKLSIEKGADEAWLGTEDNNEAAKALYDGLGPSEVEHGPLYMYKARDNKKEWD